MDGNIDIDFKEQMYRFKCIFNLNPIRSRDKIKSIQIKLDQEIEADDDSLEENIEKFNFYTWVEFKLDHYAEAIKHNKEVLKITSGKNITALINQAHMFLGEGDFGRAEECVEKAEKLKNSSDGEQLMIAVEAELAYSLSRLGKGDYLRHAIEIYTKVIEKRPENYVWKFGLGLLLRRATHVNVTTYMNSNISVIEQAKLAFRLLHEVAVTSQETCLKGRAYAQLAVLVWQSKCVFVDTNVFGDIKIEHFVDEALKYGSNDAWTLTECGRILRFYKLNIATWLLEKARDIKKHSTTLHHLGNCYYQKAKNGAGKKANKRNKVKCNKNPHNVPENKTSDQGQPTTLARTMLSKMRSPVKELALEKSSSMVAKAIKCYREAIDISLGNNVPARYSLGLILRACGDIDEALKQFNKIIIYTFKNDGPGPNRMEFGEDIQYFLTTACAYEQCAYCFLELARERGKTRGEVKKLNKEAEKSLLQAISFIATLSKLDPEMKGYEIQSKNALKTLKTQYGDLDQSPGIIKKYMELFKRARSYEKISEIIENLCNLNAQELANPDFIRVALESYLALKKYELAYTFLTFPMITQNCIDSLDALADKVRMYTAASRLQVFDSSAKFILKPLFDSYFEKVKATSCLAEKSQVNDNTQYTQDHDFTDVLILYDENEENPSLDVSVKVKKLQEIISEEFGLEVRNIDETSIPGQITLNRQIREILGARTVLILLSEERQSRSFQSLLEFIPTSKMACSRQGSSGPHVLLGIQDDSVHVPKILMAYARINLWSLLDRIQNVSKQGNMDDSKCIGEIVSPANPLDAVASLTDSQCIGAMAGHDFEARPRESASDVGVGVVRSSSPDLVELKDSHVSLTPGEEFDDCTTAKMSLFCAIMGKDWRQITS